MKLAPQPVRRNPHAKSAPPNPSILAQKTRAKRHAVSPFRINTCKSVSKQRTLTSFRINTCEKRGEGGVSLTRIRQTSQVPNPVWVPGLPTPTEFCQLTADSAFPRTPGAITGPRQLGAITCIDAHVLGREVAGPIPRTSRA